MNKNKKKKAPVYREDLTVSKKIVETMEPTIFFIYVLFHLLLLCFLIPSINTISYFEVQYFEKYKKIVVGEVIVARAIGIFFFIHWKNPFLLLIDQEEEKNN